MEFRRQPGDVRSAPEADDARTLAAVRALAAARIVTPILVLDPVRPDSHAEARATGVQCLDPATDLRAPALAAPWFFVVSVTSRVSPADAVCGTENAAINRSGPTFIDELARTLLLS